MVCKSVRINLFLNRYFVHKYTYINIYVIKFCPKFMTKYIQICEQLLCNKTGIDTILRIYSQFIKNKNVKHNII